MLNLIQTDNGPPLQEQLSHIALPWSLSWVNNLFHPIRIVQSVTSRSFS
jgi:hypothetical protein